MKRIFMTMACGLCLLQAVFAQKLDLPSDVYQAPLDIDLLLAGNYGELRPNHFHAGLDFKTQSVINLPVYSFADGYVHRVGINAYGYGLVLYVRHPQLGLTSVYAHLNDFAEPILSKIRAKQVAEEKNNAELTFAPDEIPVTKGMLIAKSGNTGSSGGPHVHFELRDCNDADDMFYDPMPLFKKQIKDKAAPRIEQIYIYPLGGKVMGGTERKQSGIVRQPNGSTNLVKRFTAWGRIGLGIKVFDHMDGQANTYGVKYLKLYSGDRLIFSYTANQFRYSERRFSNSVIDYDAWLSHRSKITKCYIEPGNKLQMLDFSLGDGTVVIDEERAYPFRFEVSDEFGNKTEFSFSVKGVRTELPAPKPLEGYCYNPNSTLDIDTLGCSVHFPKGALYSESDIVIKEVELQQPVDNLAERILKVGNLSMPLHQSYKLSIKLPRELVDTLSSPKQLYITNLDGGYIGGKYENGSIKASLREFGRFVVRCDQSKPTASFAQLTWNRSQLRITDTGSGIARYKVWIDDSFVPFDMDNRGRYIAHPRNYGIKKGKQHKIRIWLIDQCGNENTIETTKYF